MINKTTINKTLDQLISCTIKGNISITIKKSEPPLKIPKQLKNKNLNTQKIKHHIKNYIKKKVAAAATFLKSYLRQELNVLLVI